jgi:hypothetical protein
VVFRLDQPRDPITCGEDEVQARLRQPDQSFDGGAPSFLRRGQLGHGAIVYLGGFAAT